MGKGNLKFAGILIVALAAVFAIGCSTDNPTSPTNAIQSSAVNLESAPVDPNQRFPQSIEGLIVELDFDKRTFMLAERAGLEFYVETDATVISIPDGTDLKFAERDPAVSFSRMPENTVSVGADVVAYGQFKGNELFIVDRLEVLNNQRSVNDPEVSELN